MLGKIDELSKHYVCSDSGHCMYMGPFMKKKSYDCISQIENIFHLNVPSHCKSACALNKY